MVAKSWTLVAIIQFPFESLRIRLMPVIWKLRKTAPSTFSLNYPLGGGFHAALDWVGDNEPQSLYAI